MSLSAPVLNSQIIDQLKQIVGEKNVLTSPSDLFLYSFDSALDRAIPSAVVLPETSDQVALVVGVLFKNKKPFVARGAATSLCGGPVALQGGVVIGLAKLNRVIKFEKEKREILVEPGVINLQLQQRVSPDGLFYPPDPGSQKACTIGGNVATNAGGPHCLKYGVTSNFVAGLDWVFPSGERMHFKLDDPGYDILGFLVGSEGTLGIATRIRLKLLPQPKVIRTMLVSFGSIEEAIESVTDIIASGLLPATLEAMDKTTIAAVEAFAHAGYPLGAEAVLLIEVDGETPQELDLQMEKIDQVCRKKNRLEFKFAKSEEERAKLWEGRRGAYPAMARLAPNVLVEDGAVPRTQLPEALRQIKRIAEEAGLRVALLFHAGDGNLHPQIIFDERNKEHTKIVKEAGQKMLKVCVDLGGTISGEHGIGTDKREAMKWLFSRETLLLFRRLKNAFDPENLCNPDKLIPLVSKSTTAGDKSASKDEVSALPEKAVSLNSEKELVEKVTEFSHRKQNFGVEGTQSKFNLPERIQLSMKNLSAIVDFDQSNFTLTVQAGAVLTAVKEIIEKENRFLWMSGHGTVGGILATRSSLFPALRDQILGMRVLLPTGELVKFGAKTMKNVAGYDVAKLLLGSWGTLGIIVDVTLRLFPMPAPSQKFEENPQPFIFREIHRTIKKAFDPNSLFGMRMSQVTEKELALASKPRDQHKKNTSDEADLKSLEDKFWM
ncbi:MAG: hypothetical protein KCHDKBKB_01193 [Elusimicrobia bacterium]|nr:hypothetical protein [Elusimicrobiota bacterium]